MERLTMRNSDGTVSQPTATTVEQVFYRLAEYEDTGFAPEEFRAMAATLKALQLRFQPFIKADDDGRLVILPCKIGDSIWQIETNRKGKASLAVYPEYRVREYKVSTIYGGEDKLSIFAGMVLPDGTLTTSYDVFEEDDFGKTLFTSKEDALKEVERRNGEHHCEDT